MSHDDYECEPVPGLPQRLPAGEHMIWQGAPDWRALAISALHVRKVVVYFGVLLAWTIAAGAVDGESTSAIASSALRLSLLAAVAVALLLLIAWLASRSTVYTITNRRVVMRFGIALPMTLNIPFGQIQSAALRQSGATTGDICLTLAPGRHFAYLLLWPHARPWHFAHPMPMLRALADVSSVAAHLRGMLASDADEVATTRAATPVRPQAEAFPLGSAVSLRQAAH